MKRLLVVDDERPVVDGISLIVRRELAAEFEVAGTAASGREAVEKAGVLSPDIILMDVRMPGLTGLEAIREIRARDPGAVFILVTAYERFDIAREAVGLGVLDYLLKPVAKDRLALTLRAASDFVDRRHELELKELEYREEAERLGSLVEASFLQGIVLGEDRRGDLALYRQALGLVESHALAIAVSCSAGPASPDSREGTPALHARIRETLRYKTRSLAGPLFDGRCLVLLPFSGEGRAEAARKEFISVLEAGFGAELGAKVLRLGFGRPHPIEEANLSWCEALCDLFSPRSPSLAGQAGRDAAEPDDVRPAEAREKPFEEDERFLEELMAGSPEKAGLSLDALLEALRRAGPEGPGKGREGLYRVISVIGEALRGLARRGLLDAAEAQDMLDLEDLHAAWGSPGFDAVARARLVRIVAVMGRTPRWSAPVARALAYIKDNYGRQIGLELAADSVGLSPNRLSRLLVEETGRGFSDLLIDYRIERAKALLVEPGASIKQVSIACGYPDPNYFSRLFKKVTGRTPSSFPNGPAEARDEHGGT